MAGKKKKINRHQCPFSAPKRRKKKSKKVFSHKIPSILSPLPPILSPFISNYSCKQSDDESVPPSLRLMSEPPDSYDSGWSSQFCGTSLQKENNENTNSNNSILKCEKERKNIRKRKTSCDIQNFPPRKKNFTKTDISENIQNCITGEPIFLWAEQNESSQISKVHCESYPINLVFTRCNEVGWKCYPKIPFLHNNMRKLSSKRKNNYYSQLNSAIGVKSKNNESSIIDPFDSTISSPILTSSGEMEECDKLQNLSNLVTSSLSMKFDASPSSDRYPKLRKLLVDYQAKTTKNEKNKPSLSVEFIEAASTPVSTSISDKKKDVSSASDMKEESNNLQVLPSLKKKIRVYRRGKIDKKKNYKSSIPRLVVSAISSPVSSSIRDKQEENVTLTLESPNKLNLLPIKFDASSTDMKEECNNLLALPSRKKKLQVDQQDKLVKKKKYKSSLSVELIDAASPPISTSIRDKKEVNATSTLESLIKSNSLPIKIDVSSTNMKEECNNLQVLPSRKKKLRVHHRDKPSKKKRLSVELIDAASPPISTSIREKEEVNATSALESLIKSNSLPIKIDVSSTNMKEECNNLQVLLSRKKKLRTYHRDKPGKKKKLSVELIDAASPPISTSTWDKKEDNVTSTLGSLIKSDLVPINIDVSSTNMKEECNNLQVLLSRNKKLRTHHRDKSDKKKKLSVELIDDTSPPISTSTRDKKEDNATSTLGSLIKSNLVPINIDVSSTNIKEECNNLQVLPSRNKKLRTHNHHHRDKSDKKKKLSVELIDDTSPPISTSTRDKKEENVTSTLKSLIKSNLVPINIDVSSTNMKEECSNLPVLPSLKKKIRVHRRGKTIKYKKYKSSIPRSVIDAISPSITQSFNEKEEYCKSLQLSIKQNNSTNVPSSPESIIGADLSFIPTIHDIPSSIDIKNKLNKVQEILSNFSLNIPSSPESLIGSDSPRIPTKVYVSPLSNKNLEYDIIHKLPLTYGNINPIINTPSSPESLVDTILSSSITGFDISSLYNNDKMKNIKNNNNLIRDNASLCGLLIDIVSPVSNKEKFENLITPNTKNLYVDKLAVTIDDSVSTSLTMQNNNIRHLYNKEEKLRKIKTNNADPCISKSLSKIIIHNAISPIQNSVLPLCNEENQKNALKNNNHSYIDKSSSGIIHSVISPSFSIDDNILSLCNEEKQNNTLTNNTNACIDESLSEVIGNSVLPSFHRHNNSLPLYNAQEKSNNIMVTNINNSSVDKSLLETIDDCTLLSIPECNNTPYLSFMGNIYEHSQVCISENQNNSIPKKPKTNFSFITNHQNSTNHYFNDSDDIMCNGIIELQANSSENFNKGGCLIDNTDDLTINYEAYQVSNATIENIEPINNVKPEPTAFVIDGNCMHKELEINEILSYQNIVNKNNDYDASPIYEEIVTTVIKEETPDILQEIEIPPQEAEYQFENTEIAINQTTNFNEIIGTEQSTNNLNINQDIKKESLDSKSNFKNLTEHFKETNYNRVNEDLGTDNTELSFNNSANNEISAEEIENSTCIYHTAEFSEEINPNPATEDFVTDNTELNFYNSADNQTSIEETENASYIYHYNYGIMKNDKKFTCKKQFNNKESNVPNIGLIIAKDQFHDMETSLNNSEIQETKKLKRRIKRTPMKYTNKIVNTPNTTSSNSSINQGLKNNSGINNLKNSISVLPNEKEVNYAKFNVVSENILEPLPAHLPFNSPILMNTLKNNNNFGINNKDNLQFLNGIANNFGSNYQENGVLHPNNAKIFNLSTNSSDSNQPLNLHFPNNKDKTAIKINNSDNENNMYRYKVNITSPEWNNMIYNPERNLNIPNSIEKYQKEHSNQKKQASDYLNQYLENHTSNNKNVLQSLLTSMQQPSENRNEKNPKENQKNVQKVQRYKKQSWNYENSHQSINKCEKHPYKNYNNLFNPVEINYDHPSQFEVQMFGNLGQYKHPHPNSPHRNALLRNYNQDRNNNIEKRSQDTIKNTEMYEIKHKGCYGEHYFTMPPTTTANNSVTNSLLSNNEGVSYYYPSEFTFPTKSNNRKCNIPETSFSTNNVYLKNNNLNLKPPIELNSYIQYPYSISNDAQFRQPYLPLPALNNMEFRPSTSNALESANTRYPMNIFNTPAFPFSQLSQNPFKEVVNGRKKMIPLLQTPAFATTENIRQTNKRGVSSASTSNQLIPNPWIGQNNNKTQRSFNPYQQYYPYGHFPYGMPSPYPYYPHFPNYY